MRRILAFIASIVLLSSMAIAQPYVIYDGNSDEQCSISETIRDFGSRHYIAIANPVAVQSEVEITFLAQHMIAGSGFYGVDVYFVNGFDTLFGSSPTVTLNDLGSSVEIAIEVGATVGNGLPVSADTIRYMEIVFYLDVSHLVMEEFCFDSAATSLGDWHFAPGPTPTWEAHPDNPGQGTPACFGVEVWPNMDPVTLDCVSIPASLATTRFCTTMQLAFDVGWAIYGNPSYIFYIVDGPGSIDSFSGIWSWTPSASDAEQIIHLEVGLRYKYCDPDWQGPWTYDAYPRCELDLIPGPNAPPSFANQHETEVTVSGQPLLMQCPVNDDDPCTDYTFSYFVPTDEPTPPIQCDPVTGEVSYPANPDDTNTYHFSLVVAEGQYADTTEITLYHWDSPLCGDMNHDGSSDIADLTWLVGYAFKNGVSPSPPEAGNVNCLTGIDVSDVTYMVKYMFASGPDPCDCI